MKALALVALLALGACAAGPALRASATLPADARSEPQQYVVVTVRNPYLPPPVHAASTARGYDGSSVYATGAAAYSTSHAIAVRYGLNEVASWPIAMLGVHCLVYGVPAGKDAAGVVAELGHDSRVESAQPLLSFASETSGYNDPYADLQRNVLAMDLHGAHALSRGAGVKVAVIDTGVDTGHPDLQARTAATRNFVDADVEGFRSDAHGTAVAGVIAAVANNGLGIVGVAPDAELLAYKACWRAAASGAAAICNTFTLAQALAAAIEAGADVINLSLAGPADPLLTRIVRQGLAAGAIVVGAVPRDGRRDAFPTNIPGVIAVDVLGAGGAADTLRAPGRDVLSLAPSGHYDFFSGSSVATAEVSGLVALLRAGRHQLSAQEADALIAGSAPASGGTPNACAALTKLLRRGNCTAATVEADPTL